MVLFKEGYGLKRAAFANDDDENRNTKGKMEAPI
jgi:hypothetical protein